MQYNAVAKNLSIARKDFIAFCSLFSDGLHHINAVLAADPDGTSTLCEAMLADPAWPQPLGRFTSPSSRRMSKYKGMEPFSCKCIGPLFEEFNASCCQPWKATFGDHDNPWLVTPEQNEGIWTLDMRSNERLKTMERGVYALYDESQDSEGCKRFLEEQVRGFFEDLLQHEDLLGHPGFLQRAPSWPSRFWEQKNTEGSMVVKACCDDLSPDWWPQLQPVVERLVHGSEEALARCQARFEVLQDKLRKYEDAFRETFGHFPG